MKIFITGITGFIGRHLCELWKNDPGIELLGCARAEMRSAELPASVSYYVLDITKQHAVEALLEILQPDVVIHSAAMSRPNDCELEKPSAYAINVLATEYLVNACRRIHTRLVFISSDMVFGDNGPYSEEDATCPVNYYGETKVAAEQIVVNAGIDYAVVRTVLVYGKKLPGLKNSFLQWVYGQISRQQTIRVFTDQFRTATYVIDLCRGIDALVKSKERGIFHLCGDMVYTPYELANLVADFHQIDRQLIQPITNADMQEAAVRPKNCTLKIDKAKKGLGYQTTAMQIALQEIFAGS